MTVRKYKGNEIKYFELNIQYPLSSLEIFEGMTNRRSLYTNTTTSYMYFLVIMEVLLQINDSRQLSNITEQMK
jgi:hypothetical protein